MYNVMKKFGLVIGGACVIGTAAYIANCNSSLQKARILLVTSESGGPPKSVAQRAQMLKDKTDYDITAFFGKGRKPTSDEFPVLDSITTYVDDPWPPAQDFDVIEVSDAEALVRLNSLGYLKKSTKLIYTARSEQLVEIVAGGGLASEEKEKKKQGVRDEAWNLLTNNPPTSWVFLSNPLKEKFSKKFAQINFKVSDENKTVIGNPLQYLWERAFQSLKTSKSMEASLKFDKPLITYVGRLSEMKGTNTLVKALKKAEISADKVALIGSDDGSIDLKEYIASKKGQLSPKEIMKYVCGSIFIFPSISEAYANALQEAMSQGAVCIINADTQSLVAMLKPEASHISQFLTFSQGDSDKLAANIRNLLASNNSDLQLESKRVMQLISDNQEVINDQVVELYKNTIG